MEPSRTVMRCAFALLAATLVLRPASAPAEEDEAGEHGGWADYREWLHQGSPDPEAVAHLTGLLHPRTRWLDAPLSGAGSWQQIGPLDLGSEDSPYPDVDKGAGRIVSIAPHPTDPNTVFISSVGGLFVTHQAGMPGTWVWGRSDVGLLPGPGHLVFSDVDPDTLYYGLAGQPSGGLFVSHDAGNTWSSTGLAPLAVQSLLVSGNLVVVGTSSGIYVSNDGAATFNHPPMPSTRHGGQLAGQVTSVVQVSPTQLIATNNDFFCGTSGCAFYGEVFVSQDLGATWSAAALPAELAAPGRGRLTAAASPAGPGIAYLMSSANGLAMTRDSGATWTFVPATLTPGPDKSLVSGVLYVDPTDATHLFMGGVDLFVSTDSGATWTQISSWDSQGLPYLHADMHVLAFSLAGTPVLYIGHDGGLSFTANPYQSIPQVSGTYPNTVRYYDSSQNVGRGDLMFYRIGSTTAAAPSWSRAMLNLAAQDQGTVIRTAPDPSGLASSQTARSYPTGDGLAALIHPLDGTQWLSASYCGHIIKSTDQGQTFHASVTGIDGGCADFFTNLIPGSAPDTVFHTLPHELYRSLDFGSTWSSLPLNGVDPAAQIRYAGTSQQNPSVLSVIVDRAPWGYATSDLATYVPFGPVPNIAKAPSSVAYDPSDDATLYLSSASYSTSANHLWKSTNGGASWTALDTAGSGFPTGVPINAIRIPARVRSLVFAATGLGVYSSCDSGATWSVLGNSLPQIDTMDVYVAPDASLIRAVTSGMGAWELPLDSGGAPLTVTPEQATVASGDSMQFFAAGGGSACYGWSLMTNASGGSISATGVYVAGPLPGTDVIQLTDAFGTSALASVQVEAVDAIQSATRAPAPEPRAVTSSGCGAGPGGPFALLALLSGAARLLRSKRRLNSARGARSRSSGGSDSESAAGRT